MMVFVVMHLTNLSLNLISLQVAEAGRLWFIAIWRSLPGTVLFYGAVLVHVVLVLRSLYRRRSLVMPLREAAQVAAGLAIPLLLAVHVVGTRVFHELTEVPDTYEFVVRIAVDHQSGHRPHPGHRPGRGVDAWLFGHAFLAALPQLVRDSRTLAADCRRAGAGRLAACLRPCRPAGRADGAAAAARQRRPVADPRRDSKLPTR